MSLKNKSKQTKRGRQHLRNDPEISSGVYTSVHKHARVCTRILHVRVRVHTTHKFKKSTTPKSMKEEEETHTAVYGSKLCSLTMGRTTRVLVQSCQAPGKPPSSPVRRQKLKARDSTLLELLWGRWCWHTHQWVHKMILHPEGN